MRIIFGPTLDGFVPSDSAPTGDVAVCGPVSLVQLLELRLGIPAQRVSHGSRVAGYREALAAVGAADGPQFFHDSFAQDDYAVAATLLRWRDELVLAAWDGQPFADGGPRLAALAAAEIHFEPSLRSSEGDRLRVIAGRLAQRSARLSELVLTEPLAELPQRWQEVLKQLAARVEPVDPVLAAGAGAGASDLAQMQRWVRGGAVPSFAADGTLLVVRSHSEAILAHAAAQWCAASMGSTAVVDGGELRLLDGALARLDRPVTGAGAASIQRAIPQVLPLALRLLWEPLDPQHLLEFLMHPVSPVTGWLRHRLAESLLEAPGIGGRAWTKAVELARMAATTELAGEPAKLTATLKRMDEDLAHWVLPVRHAVANGVPGKAVAECARRVACWAKSRSETSADPETVQLFQSLEKTARELADLAGARERLTSAQLDRLLRLVAGNGWEGSPQGAEAGHLPVRRPAACIEPVETLLWWNAAGRAAGPESPWSAIERAALARAGVTVPSDAHRLALAAQWERRPLFAARRQLVLFQASQRAGEPVAEPALITRLRSLPREAGAARLFQDVDRETIAPAAGGRLQWTSLPVRPQPLPCRWWRLPADAPMPLRPRESYTSLDKFVLNPVDYVLEHSAKLTAGPFAAASVIPDSRLFGNLVHRLTELLFDTQARLDWRTASEAELAAWLAAEWQTLLPAEGATLLLPGRQSALAHLQATAHRAVANLLGVLRQVGAVRVQADHRPQSCVKLKTGGTEIELTGQLDLLVETGEGRRLVLDLKWGGERKRRAELKQGRALQLAIYARLIGSADALPPGAFLILKRGVWLTDTPGLLPGVREITPAAGGGTAACWREFLDVWAWRRGQFAEGWIEAPATGAEVDPAHAPLNPAPPHANWVPGKDDEVGKYSPYGSLLGWEADQ